MHGNDVVLRYFRVMACEFVMIKALDVSSKESQTFIFLFLATQ